MSVAREIRAATAVTLRGFWVSERFFVSPAERGRRGGALGGSGGSTGGDELTKDIASSQSPLRSQAPPARASPAALSLAGEAKKLATSDWQLATGNWQLRSRRRLLATLGTIPLMPVDFDISRVADLARIALTEDELERYTEQLEQILEHAARVQALPTDGIEPTSHPLTMVNAFRSDEVTACLDRDEVLAEAPDPEDGYFRVPRILGDE